MGSGVAGTNTNNIIKTEYGLGSEMTPERWERLPTITKLHRFIDDYQVVAQEIFSVFRNYSKTTKKYISKCVRMYEFCTKYQNKEWFNYDLVAERFRSDIRLVEQVIKGRGDVWICIEAWINYQKTGTIEQ